MSCHSIIQSLVPIVDRIYPTYLEIMYKTDTRNHLFLYPILEIDRYDRLRTKLYDRGDYVVLQLSHSELSNQM